MKNPISVLVAFAAVTVFVAGCTKSGELPTPKAVPPTLIPAPQAALATPLPPPAGFPEPNVPKGAEGPSPHVGQNNDTSSSEFKSGGAADPHK